MKYYITGCSSGQCLCGTLRNFGSQKPESVHSKHCVAEDVEQGWCGRDSPEILCHLHSFKKVHYKLVLTSFQCRISGGMVLKAKLKSTNSILVFIPAISTQ